ncbi:CPBP family intramembrane glutamic endopeptidase [Aestuariibaculum suncheonense]|uniref:CPBP family intramembrane metalloprotease n=1 Tax=Aestuariibaculum suncheonense TaxID=1028745 RepID=A0A8J6Q623_9FLAO|nr:CPBP family intramembrane glutamic endopeptidase [Aestuariibaculum suncheonense]MBD0834415.1 CPBP family intramembrane metalloprotease [Aestuariibaculum suncheonense]
MIVKSNEILFKPLALTGSLWLFSLFVNFDFPLKTVALVALILAGFWMSSIHKDTLGSICAPALWRFKKSRKWILMAFVFSLALAVYSRIEDGLPPIPSTIGAFVIVAILIGFVEEVVFRGFVQGAAQQWNPTGAVVLASVSHAGYKALLFVFPLQQLNNSALELFGYTFLAGLILGYSRQVTGSLWPAVIAHCFFDFWLYMEQSSAPWWVW